MILFSSKPGRLTIKLICALFLLIQLVVCLVIWQTSDEKAVHRDIDSSQPEIERKGNLLEGIFRVQVSLPLNKHTLVRYIVPIDPETGLPPDSASRIVFYAPYNSDAHNIANQLPEWVQDFSKIYGYTVFSLTIETNTIMANDKINYYIEPTAGWYEIIFAVKRKIESLYGFKEKKLVVVGQSSGGSMAQKMLATYPDRISCAAWCGGRIYTPFNVHSEARVLALNLWGCPGLEHTKALMSSAREHGIKFQRHVVPTPPSPNVTRQMFHHAAWQLPFDMIKAFVIDYEFEKYLLTIPKEDYGEGEFEIGMVPPSQKGMIVFLWKDADRIRLKDLLWYSYKMGFIPSYLVYPNMADADFSHYLEEVKKTARKNNTPIHFLAQPDSSLEQLAKKHSLAIQYSEFPHNLVIKLNRGNTRRR